MAISIENIEGELSDFATKLEERIEERRDLLFSYADCISERADNSGVLRKEMEGYRGFDYKNSILKLLSRLAEIETEKRKEIMTKALNGIGYKLTGVYIEVKGKGLYNAPLFSDFAENPLKYLKT